MKKLMEPRIEVLNPKKLVGSHLKMNLVQNKTAQLWGQFSPQIKEVINRVSRDKISMQIYPPSYFEKFSVENEFEKWAVVEVRDFDHISKKLETFTLKKGLYAVFKYKGSSSDNSIYQYIYGEWIQKSPYILDNRPHFEILGEKYANNDPNSEEEIWIPIQDKN